MSISNLHYKALPTHVPGPFAAARASSPMKKSRSSVPRFMDRCPPAPAPPVRYDGLFATEGLPDPEPPLPPPAPLVAIAVGKTKEGESLPAKPNVISIVSLVNHDEKRAEYSPSLEKPVPLRAEG